MYNYKIQKRRQFEIENKNKLKHNMRTVSIAFRKKKQRYRKVRCLAMFRYNCNEDFFLSYLNN